MSDIPQNNKAPREKWDEWKQTKFSDGEIMAEIDTSRQYSGCDYANEPYAQSCAMRAQAMIAYNEMIETRIERERLAL